MFIAHVALGFMDLLHIGKNNFISFNYSNLNT